MNVKAKAEGGIVISNVLKSAWSNEANANYSSVIGLYPTSTSNASAWYHAKSTNPADAQAHQTTTGAYENLTSSIVLSDSTYNEGVGYVESGTTANFQPAEDSCYYLLSKYYIRSSGDPISGNLYINNVTVSSTAANGQPSALQAIDASLRVAIVVGTTTYIYAPVTTISTGTTPIYPTFSYYVNNDTTMTSTYNPTASENGGTGAGAYQAGKNKVIVTSGIPNTVSEAIEVLIYVFFEGEDANCMSNNISTLTMNNLEVSVVFGTITVE